MTDDTQALAQEFGGASTPAQARDLAEVTSNALMALEAVQAFTTQDTDQNAEHVAQLVDHAVEDLRAFAFPATPGDITVGVKYLDHAEGLPPITKATPGSSGFDLYAAITDPISLNTVGSYALIPTGVCIELPQGYEAQVRPRSGLAAKHGISIVNTPGTIDSDYRGEIKIALINHSTNRFKVERGMRIAQMVIVGPLPSVELRETDELSETLRGFGGFGSTGV